MPEHLKEAIERYVEYHVHPGDFLTSVLENNLMESFKRADDPDTLFEVVKYIYNKVPIGSYGSKERVKTWLESAGS